MRGDWVTRVELSLMELVPLKDTPQSWSIPPTPQRHGAPGSEPSPDTAMISDFPATSTVRNKFLLVLRPAMYGIIIAAQMD